ncbi:DUF4363 family protein [Aminipila butyrica]|uniref:DUF4363 family protein n=1 Tax=Aminipila butyrica TaxID=433296 RepID=A0A858BY23_9FIRM|nr:DUF4363 family protein [Aminipila butyrica]QIB69614.1 DUF4363 family protein [Aminipila butyrica]
MRSFLISLGCLLVLAGSWLVYTNYSDEKIHEFNDRIETVIIEEVKSDRWQQAEEHLDKLEDDWHQYKKVACLFFSTNELNDIDYSFAKSKYYIKAEDLSNSSGELSYLKEQMRFLHANQEITIANLF